MSITFEDVKPAIGSIVHVERDRLLDPDNVKKCREMLDKRTVLVFKNVHLTDEEQLAFTDLMGPRMNLTSRATSDNATEEDVYKVTLDRKINKQPEYVLGTFFWHMDGVTVDSPPPFATLLSARKTSAKGGQTEFASTYAAYEGLPEEEKAELEKLRVKHSTWSSLRPIHDLIPPEDKEKLSIGVDNIHPLVWTHDNGRKSLVIGTTADQVVGMELAHSRHLLSRLIEWAVQPDYSYRHQWDEGDFVVWDNTGAMHRVLPYDWDSGRMMHRTSIAGTETIG